VFLSNLWVS